MTDQPLNTAASVTLDANGFGVAAIGPGNDGPPVWYVDDVLLTTDRPGDPPIPRAAVYLDQIAPASLQGITYDGSFGAASANRLRLIRGQQLYVVWSSGQSGDVASVTVVGTRST